MQWTDCDLERFVRDSTGKEVFCFGAGKLANEVMRDTRIGKLNPSAIYFIDNYIYGEEKEIGGRMYRILSFEEMLKRVTENTVFLITIKAVEEVYVRLSQEESLSKNRGYIYTFLLEHERDRKVMAEKLPKSIRRDDKQCIPKIIHYCWFGGKEIPKQNKKWMESWKKYCPDFEIIEWNEGNYDISKNQYMFEAYEAGKWGFVPDYARLDIIYHNGGIYLDTDVELIKNLDELLYQNGFCGFESEQRVAFGLGFGGKRKLPIFKQMRDIYDTLKFRNSNETLNLTPSPFYQTNLMQEHGLKLNGEYQVICGLTVYPEKVLCGKNFLTGKKRITEDTYAMHHYDASWFSEQQRERMQARRSLAEKM